MGVRALKSRAPDLYALLDAHADIVNMPRIGVPENCAYTSIQLNFHNAVLYEKGTSFLYSISGLIDSSALTVTGMKAAMGKSGDSHIDEHDAHGTLSTLIAAPKLLDGYEGGRFHILELGVYICLDTITVASFSSLFRHGGTPPIAPQGCDEVDLEVKRFNIILYANRFIHESETLHSLAAMPGAPVGDEEDARILKILRTSAAISNPL